jgi:hypothetical protein
MKRLIRAAAVGAVAAAVSMVVVPASLAGPQDRSIWCNADAAVTLPLDNSGGLLTIPPGNAINVLLSDGKALYAAGKVTRAYFAVGIGAFCSADSNVIAGKTVTPVLTNGAPTIVNNLGWSLPGDGGAIYQLVTVT